MSFAAPLILLGLLLLPVAAIAYTFHERRRERGRAAFSTPALRPAVTPRRTGWRRHVAPALYALALAVLVVALARPQRSVAVPVEQATVLLVIDHSGSMRATDVRPDRLSAVKRAADRFLDRVPTRIRVGAIAFNHKVQPLVGPSLDRGRVRASIDALTARGGTAIGDALHEALDEVKSARQGDARTPAAIVLLSDGTSVKGRDPVRVAEQARRARVPVDTVALGTDAGTLSSRRANGSIKTEPVPPDRATLRKVAQISGGTASEARDATALDAVYERLGSRVATKPERREVTAAVAGGALMLVLAGLGLSLGLTGRVV